MANPDWFRSTTWDPQIEAEFEKRLKRSRTRYNQAQYLKIQGLSLLPSAEAQTRGKGVELLRRVLSDYPDESTEVAHTHECLADHFRSEGKYVEAEVEYREVLAYYAKTPSRTNTSGLADLSLVEMILEAQAAEKYPEAKVTMQGLREARGESILFNSDVFRYHATWARLLARMGSSDEACQHARRALEVAQIRAPQFPRHPTVGIPNPPQPVVDELFESLKAGPA